MTVSGSIPVNLKKFNNKVIMKTIDYINENNKDFSVELVNGTIEGTPQINFVNELDFKVKFVQDGEHEAYANIFLELRKYCEEDYKTGGRNDNTREFNEILEQVSPDAVLIISVCPRDDFYYLLYLNFFQAMLVTLKSVGKNVEYIFNYDLGAKDLKYTNADYFEKWKGMYIKKRKKDYKEMPPKVQAENELFSGEFATYEELLKGYYKTDYHNQTWISVEEYDKIHYEVLKKEQAAANAYLIKVVVGGILAWGVIVYLLGCILKSVVR